MDNNALITTAVITGIIAVLTMVCKSVRKSECLKTDKGVCCDFDTRTVRSSSSTLDTVIEHIPHKVAVPAIVSTEV
jgi:hypothetical protein